MTLDHSFANTFGTGLLAEGLPRPNPTQTQATGLLPRQPTLAGLLGVQVDPTSPFAPPSTAIQGIAAGSQLQGPLGLSGLNRASHFVAQVQAPQETSTSYGGTNPFALGVDSFGYATFGPPGQAEAVTPGTLLDATVGQENPTADAAQPPAPVVSGADDTGVLGDPGLATPDEYQTRPPDDPDSAQYNTKFIAEEAKDWADSRSDDPDARKRSEQGFQGFSDGAPNISPPFDSVLTGSPDYVDSANDVLIVRGVPEMTSDGILGALRYEKSSFIPPPGYKLVLDSHTHPFAKKWLVSTPQGDYWYSGDDQPSQQDINAVNVEGGYNSDTAHVLGRVDAGHTQYYFGPGRARLPPSPGPGLRMPKPIRRWSDFSD